MQEKLPYEPGDLFWEAEEAIGIYQPDRSRKTTKNFNKDRRFFGLDFNLEPSEYEGGRNFPFLGSHRRFRK
jgi:hypothetical protein